MRFAIDTICSPEYANIFMTQFEKQHIYLYTKNNSILYLRDINDLFMIWTEIKEELLVFLENLYIKRDH